MTDDQTVLQHSNSNHAQWMCELLRI